MAEQFIFDAFISYRHVEPDSFVAKNIHKMLENYKLPGNVRKKIKKVYGKDCKTKITRIFRDEEELLFLFYHQYPDFEQFHNRIRDAF